MAKRCLRGKYDAKANEYGKDFEKFGPVNFPEDFFKTLRAPNGESMKKAWLLPALVLAGGCSLDSKQLKGRWRAVALYQTGQSVHAALDSVRLVFSENDQYVFRSAGFYNESGPFRASGYYLFLTDTTVRPPREHTLMVLHLSDDTLKIRMKKGGMEQVLFLAREK